MCQDKKACKKKKAGYMIGDKIIVAKEPERKEKQVQTTRWSVNQVDIWHKQLPPPPLAFVYLCVKKKEKRKKKKEEEKKWTKWIDGISIVRRRPLGVHKGLFSHVYLLQLLHLEFDYFLPCIEIARTHSTIDRHLFQLCSDDSMLHQLNIYKFMTPSRHFITTITTTSTSLAIFNFNWHTHIPIMWQNYPFVIAMFVCFFFLYFLLLFRGK